MLSHSVTRLLSRGRTQTLSLLVGTSNNIRTYYNNPDSIDYMAKFLRERQMMIQERAKVPEEVPLVPIMQSAEDFFDMFAPRPPPRVTLRFDNYTEWWKIQSKKLRIRDQRDHHQRQLVLGYDLAAAHFVLLRKGKVRFVGHSDWMQPRSYGKIPSLPDVYHPDYIVEAMDLSQTEIEYEGLENISNLSRLKWLSFKDSATINDWSLDKISGEYPSLEYLDISGCQDVSERGLEALYRLPSLKTLIVTNHYNSPAFELSCYMLEDVNPHLKCTIYTPKPKSGSEETDG